MTPEMEKRRDELAGDQNTYTYTGRLASGDKRSIEYRRFQRGFNAAAEIYEKEQVGPLVKKCHAVLEDTRRLPELIILLNELGLNERED